MQRFRSPETVIGRFVVRRTVRSATFIALIFAAFVAAKAEGYISAFPSLQSREALSASFASNIGLKALLGAPHQLQTVAGFAVWNTFIIMVMIGAIWAYLTATRLFRGEEESGRWEILLSGLTTARRGAANTLVGLAASLSVLFFVTAATFVAIGSIDKIHFGASSAIYFALATTLAAVLFAGVGALASQFMPTRARAAGLSTGIFGLFFLLRAGGDITSAHWLLYFSPLGWIELLQPLANSQPPWLIPIITLIAVLATATIWLAGRRDLGASIIPDHDTAKPHLTLLHGFFTMSLRQTRGTTIAWLAGVAGLAVFFGLLTKTAAQAISDSLTAQNLVSHLTQASQKLLGAQTFLGIIFFFLTTVIMAYAASAISTMREDEAQGYLDNFLVRPVGRLHWLAGRLTIIVVTIALAGLIASSVVWVCMNVIGIEVTWHDLLMAGLNTFAPAAFVLGIGVATMGLLPRHTALIAYGVVGWSFLVQMLSSGLNLNHWLLDLSIFHHVAFAPAVDPTWGTNLRLVIMGLILALIGALAFEHRDLVNE
jgi:ABC-2 type transport system permease protein